jgi:hypothetical protein
MQKRSSQRIGVACFGVLFGGIFGVKFYQDYKSRVQLHTELKQIAQVHSISEIYQAELLSKEAYRAVFNDKDSSSSDQPLYKFYAYTALPPNTKPIRSIFGDKTGVLLDVTVRREYTTSSETTDEKGNKHTEYKQQSDTIADYLIKGPFALSEFEESVDVFPAQQIIVQDIPSDPNRLPDMQQDTNHTMVSVPLEIVDKTRLTQKISENNEDVSFIKSNTRTSVGGVTRNYHIDEKILPLNERLLIIGNVFPTDDGKNLMLKNTYLMSTRDEYDFIKHNNSMKRLLLAMSGVAASISGYSLYYIIKSIR